MVVVQYATPGGARGKNVAEADRQRRTVARLAAAPVTGTGTRERESGEEKAAAGGGPEKMQQRRRERSPLGGRRADTAGQA